MEHASSVGDSKKLYRLFREASGKKSSPAPAAINDANGNPSFAYCKHCVTFVVIGLASKQGTFD
jgi:hypothetical protein